MSVFNVDFLIRLLATGNWERHLMQYLYTYQLPGDSCSSIGFEMKTVTVVILVNHPVIFDFLALCINHCTVVACTQ